MSTAPQPGKPPAEAPVRRRWGLRRSGAEGTTAPAPAPDEAETTADGAAPAEEPVPFQPHPPGARRLRRDRRRLVTEREDAVYHLGGLAFELHRRDLLPDGVMLIRASEVAQLDDRIRDIDVRLSEIDRERRERRAAEPVEPAVGCCLACRTPFRPEARFCWQCGAQVVPPPVGGDDQPTAVISGPGAA